MAKGFTDEDDALLEELGVEIEAKNRRANHELQCRGRARPLRLLVKRSMIGAASNARRLRIIQSRPVQAHLCAMRVEWCG